MCVCVCVCVWHGKDGRDGEGIREERNEMAISIMLNAHHAGTIIILVYMYMFVLVFDHLICSFLKELQLRQSENLVIDSISDILLLYVSSPCMYIASHVSLTETYVINC